jgi:uncharacterized protein
MSWTKDFVASFLFSVLAVVIVAWVEFAQGFSVTQILHSCAIVIILALLEISISFDNAVVNATVLKQMTPIWQRRFLTWGILIAVFGMRIIFPIGIVAVLAEMNPIAATMMAIQDPQRYAQIMLSSHHEVAAFGGAFLMLVALKYFFDSEKSVHWLRRIEKHLVRLGHLEASEIALTLLTLIGFALMLPSEKQFGFLLSGVVGVLCFVMVESLGEHLKKTGLSHGDLNRQSAGMFLYLEVLDASFSFDGVVGAFAITNNVLIIAVGLGIGAFFVRSLTLLLVKNKTIDTYPFLEHGAFYAVGFLAMVMFFSTIFHIPEIATGGISALILGLSLVASHRFNAKSRR